MQSHHQGHMELLRVDSQVEVEEVMVQVVEEVEGQDMEEVEQVVVDLVTVEEVDMVGVVVVVTGINKKATLQSHTTLTTP